MYRLKGRAWKSKKTGGATSLWLGSMKAGKMYEFKVRAYRRADKKYGPWSAVSYGLMRTVTAKVKAAKKGFTVTWKKAKGATGYQVIFSDSSSMANPFVYTVGSHDRKCTFSSLDPKTRYYVQVRPVKKSGKVYQGICSSKKSVVTK